MSLAIKTHELGKRYTLGLHRDGNLRESLSSAARRPLQALRGGRGEGREPNTLWALRDVSLEIADGEVVGLIGHNGAGKSTFLKLISRITEPSAGWAEVTGRTGSLLEVGTGFHPELTGRENIFLNGAILGMRRAEIRRRFDEIVSFAEVERFLDTPVKRYSSGMSVRLAFSVAAHLEPEILLVDEVLAVGDAAFQRRSLARMGEVAKEGRTVVFVSHNLAIIRALCERGILLDQGSVVVDAPAEDAIDEYLKRLESSASDDLLERTDRMPRTGSECRVRRVAVRDVAAGQSDVLIAGRPATIVVEVTDVLPEMHCRLIILNSLGQPVATLNSEVPSPRDERDPELGPRIECELGSLPLLPGRYRVDVRVESREQTQDNLHAAAYFDIEPGVIADRPMPPQGADGDVMLDHVWRLPG
jgi:lipopolysaccharide transport system ATP-binding protein